LPEIRIDESTRSGRWRAFWSGLGLVFVGGAVGLILMIIAALLWGKLAELGISL
jgi:hypothetical protein